MYCQSSLFQYLYLGVRSPHSIHNLDFILTSFFEISDSEKYLFSSVDHVKTTCGPAKMDTNQTIVDSNSDAPAMTYLEKMLANPPSKTIDDIEARLRESTAGQEPEPLKPDPLEKFVIGYPRLAGRLAAPRHVSQIRHHEYIKPAVFAVIPHPH